MISRTNPRLFRTIYKSACFTGTKAHILTPPPPQQQQRASERRADASSREKTCGDGGGGTVGSGHLSPVTVRNGSPPRTAGAVRSVKKGQVQGGVKVHACVLLC
jgi:hypothetical protein